TGFIGMTTKFTEVTLALKYREQSESGHMHGGPMYVIKNGLSKKFHWLGWGYAFFAILSSFGAGNMFQSNQMASIINHSLGVPTWISGLVFAALAFIVLIGGITRIAKVTSKLVPAMVCLYLFGALWVIFANYTKIPAMFGDIFHYAFTGHAATGAFTGVVLKEVIIQGVRRATFSSEAGMGSAAMAHSAAKSSPVQEGVVALLEPFVDTIMVCTITALALLITDAWTIPGIEGVELTARAFTLGMGPIGGWIVTFVVTLFAFSTLISWSYYGEQGVTYIWGEKAIPAYRYVFVLFVFLGAIAQLQVVLNISDGVYGLLAIPNILAAFLLMPKVREILTDYKKKLKSGEIKAFK
ncbi:MAG: alanine/glycine:cation symporter family protein, partial [Bacteriovoracaceae bacterium]